MGLNLGVGDSNYKKHTVRHEFGHALGLGHEHQSKNAPSGLLNKEAVVNWLMKAGKMTKKDAESQYDRDYEKPRPNQYPDEVATTSDPTSIMQYWLVQSIK